MFNDFEIVVDVIYCFLKSCILTLKFIPFCVVL